MPGDQSRPDAQAATLRSLQTALLRDVFLATFGIPLELFGDGLSATPESVGFSTGLFLKDIRLSLKEAIVFKIFVEMAPPAPVLRQHFNRLPVARSVQQLQTHRQHAACLKMPSEFAVHPQTGSIWLDNRICLFIGHDFFEGAHRIYRGQQRAVTIMWGNTTISRRRQTPVGCVRGST